MERKRPQLNPDDLGRLRWGLGAVLALLSVVTVFFMDVAAGLIMPVVAVAALAALLWPQWPARVPGFVHRLAFPFIALAFVYDLTSTSEPLPALIRLDLLLILYRLITYRQRRDDLQLVLLGLFLIIVAGVITVSISFAIQLIAFTGCALIMLLAVTLEHTDGRAPKAPAPGVVPSWTRGSWRQHFRKLKNATDWRLTVLGIAGFSIMVVLSGFLFLAIPRFDIQSSLFIDRLLTRTTKSGFSEEIRFGDVTSITQDDSLAFSVDVTDPTALPRSPYWRMVVLDEYTGEGFRLSQDFKRSLNGFRVPRRRVNGTRTRRDGSPPIFTIFMEPGISRYLPITGDFYWMRFQEPLNFILNTKLRVVALQREPVKMFAYETWNMGTDDALYDATFALARRDDSTAGANFLVLPDDELDQNRLTTLLAEILPTDRTPDIREFGQLTMQWLSDVHPYALSSAVPDGDGDNLLRWLESEAAGHCEFFAGSFVMLARAAGYPARIVTGFRGGRWNDFSNSFMVRNSNAHAWTEVFDSETSSWIRFDPTPGNWQESAQLNDPNNLGAAAIPRDSSWAARLDSLKIFWYRRIVNFDNDSQAELVSTTKQFFQTKWRAVQDWTDTKITSVRDWLKQPWDVSRLLTMTATVLGVIGIVWWWQKAGNRWWLALRRKTNRRSDQDPVRREASRWLRREAKRDAFRWPEDVRSDLLRLRFGDADSWQDPDQVFRAAKATWRST
ncbi:transglutaminaseTgpA domain-containing protein [Opitutaceae bacterium]|nr:transglutaminaseTgpA domain-containing protein [Opitutaceae bacterium]